MAQQLEAEKVYVPGGHELDRWRFAQWLVKTGKLNEGLDRVSRTSFVEIARREDAVFGGKP